MNIYYIYKITNPKGKVYIGQSKNKRRIKEYKWIAKDSKQALISRSIYKYGYINHKFEILFNNLSKEEANNKEIELISSFKQLGISLNISPGGQLSSYTYRKRVIQFDINSNYIATFDSIKDAAIAINCDSSSITKCIKSMRYYCKGFLFCYEGDYINGFIPKWIAKLEKKTTAKRQFNIFDLEGRFIKSYKSAEQAAKELNISSSAITSNLRGVTKRAKQFIFSFEHSVESYIHPNAKQIYQLDHLGNIVKKFKDYKDASKKLSVSCGVVIRILKGKKVINKYKNIKLKYKND